MIFNPPERTKGMLMSAEFASNGPAMIGERDDPVVRAIPVIPAAAERSSGSTTAMV